MNVELQRLDHVSLNVSDRARSIEWYRDVLGLEQRGTPDADDEPVFMGEFGACVALFQAQSPAPARDRESTGFRHLAFLVARDALDRAQSHLSDRQVDFQFEDHGMSHSVYFRDPDGHTIELTSYDV